MAPTDPNAKLMQKVHKPLVVMSPAGEETFGVECTAGDFRCDENFKTQQEARESAGITEHVMLHLHLADHRVAVIAISGDLTFTPRCLASDFMIEDVFDTLKEARASKAINEHVDLENLPKVRRRW